MLLYVLYILSVAASVITGIIVTGNPLCLGGIFFLFFMQNVIPQQVASDEEDDGRPIGFTAEV